MVILSLLPFIFIFLGLAGFKIRGVYVGPVGLLLTALLANVFWETPIPDLLDLTASGLAWTAFVFVWSVFGAFFLLNFLLEARIIEAIRKALISKSGKTSEGMDVILIGFSLAILLGTVAPAGTNFAITSTILTASGMRPFDAGVIGLFGNGVQSPFGLVGVSVYSLSQATGMNLQQLAVTIALMMIPFSITAPLWTVCFLRIQLTRKLMLAAIVVGLVHTLATCFSAMFLGPELPNLVAGASSMLTCLLLLSVLYKKKVKMRVKPFLPLLIVFSLLIATRLVEPVNRILTHPTLELRLDFLTGATVRFSYLYSPGTIMIITTVVSSLLVNKRSRRLYACLKKTVKQVVPILIATSSFVAISNIMRWSGMTFLLAEATVSTVGIFYPFFSPLLGMLGSAVTGSTAASNIFFGSFQIGIAERLGLPQSIISSSQTIGSMAGEIISPLNCTVVAASLGISRSEGLIIRKTVASSILYLLIAGLVTYSYSLIR